MAGAGTISTDDLKDRLLAQLDLLVHQFAPPANGSYTKGELYFTLNPGRADRHVGSFCIHMSGAKAGRWIDYASGDRGDVIDLIGLNLGITDPAAKFREARAWLGLDTEDPATRRRREEQAARMKQQREAQAAQEAERRARQRKTAQAVWLSAEPNIIGTAVDFYLRGRGIDLSLLPHIPGAIRFHPECRYYFTAEVEDPETGEITTRHRYRPMPAMVTAIARGPKIIDCHRTYLERGGDGIWRKAAVEDAKKVFGDYTGGSVRLCGAPGPRGGRLKLRDAPQGARVFVAEGIENALSLIMLRHLEGLPPDFVIAAGMIANLAHVDLPATVASVVLAADNDSGAQAGDMLDRAIKAHAKAGREVRVWRSDTPGHDLNDDLQAVLAAMKLEGAA
ncbi:MAG: toprim domain-containing protein [Pseudomonadota bacterium]